LSHASFCKRKTMIFSPDALMNYTGNSVYCQEVSETISDYF